MKRFCVILSQRKTKWPPQIRRSPWRDCVCGKRADIRTECEPPTFAAEIDDHDRIRYDETRKHIAEINVINPKLPNISGPVTSNKSRDAPNTTRRSERWAPATPTAATKRSTVGIPRESIRKPTLPSGMPVRPCGQGPSIRSARPLKFHMTHGSTTFGNAWLAMTHHRNTIGLRPAIAMPTGVNRKSFACTVTKTGYAKTLFREIRHDAVKIVFLT